MVALGYVIIAVGTFALRLGTPVFTLACRRFSLSSSDPDISIRFSETGEFGHNSSIGSCIAPRGERELIRVTID